MATVEKQMSQLAELPADKDQGADLSFVPKAAELPGDHHILWPDQLREPQDMGGEPDLSFVPSEESRQPSFRQGEPPSFFDRALRFLSEDSPAERKAQALNAIATKEVLDDEAARAGKPQNMGLFEIWENRDQLNAEMGMRQQPNTQELVGGLMSLAIAHGMASAGLVKTLAGLAAFVGASEATKATLSLLSEKDYEFGAPLSEYLPADAGRNMRFVVDAAEFLAAAKLGHLGAKLVPQAAVKVRDNLFRQITKEVLPRRTVYISPEKIRSLQLDATELTEVEAALVKEAGLTGAQWRQALRYGMDVQVPAEAIIRIADRPWFAKLKDVFKISPYQDTSVTRVELEPDPRRPGQLRPKPAQGQPRAAGQLPEESSAAKPKSGPSQEGAKKAAPGEAPEATISEQPIPEVGVNRAPEEAIPPGGGAEVGQTEIGQPGQEPAAPRPQLEVEQDPPWLSEEVGLREGEQYPGGALGELNRARDVGEIDEGTYRLASMLLAYDPEFDANSTIEIIGSVRLASRDIVAEEGLDPEKPHAIAGKTVSNLEGDLLRTAIRLYRGHDGADVVEEWYHRFFDRLGEQDRGAYQEYHRASGDSRKVNEHFAQEGRDFFFSEGMHEGAGGIRSLFAKAREALKALIRRIRALRGANIPEPIKKMYRMAGQPQPRPRPDHKPSTTEVKVKPVTVGADTVAVTERGTEVTAVWGVVEADRLVTSHTRGMRINPDFPPELQPRDRSRAASMVQVSRMAKRLDPARLAHSRIASDGAPIVGWDGVVESGNGRVIAVRKAYQGKKGAEYQRWLVEHAEEFGLKPHIVAAADQPVLVRLRTSEVDRPAFVREANEAAVATMSATEVAMADASAMLEEGVLALFVPNNKGIIDTKDNRAFVEAFLRLVSPNDLGALRDNRTGRLSQAGETRVRNAIFAAAFGESLALEALAESTDNLAKNITRALTMAAPRIVRLKTDIAAGRAHDLDISAEIVWAADKLMDLRRNNTKLGDYLAQRDLFVDIDPVSRRLLQIYDKYGRGAGYKKILAILETYQARVESLGDPRQGVMFGQAETPSSLELLNMAEADPGWSAEQARQAAFEAFEAEVARSYSLKELHKVALKALKDDPATIEKMAEKHPIFLDLSGHPGVKRVQLRGDELAGFSEANKHHKVAAQVAEQFQKAKAGRPAKTPVTNRHLGKEVAVGRKGVKHVGAYRGKSDLELAAYTRVNELLRGAVVFSLEPKDGKVPANTVYRLFAALQDAEGGVHRVRMVVYPTEDGLYLYDLAIRKKLEGLASEFPSAAPGAARGPIAKPSMVSIPDLLQGVKPGQVTSYSLKEIQPTWYSQLERTIEAKLPGSGSSTQLLDTIRSWSKKGLYKDEELQWSGLEQWLGEADGKVSKVQVLEFLRGNKLEIQEKHNVAGDARYSEYQEPGGDNYRELLLTLPDQGLGPARQAFIDFKEKMQKKYLVGGQWLQKINAAEEAERARLAEAAAHEPEASFEGSHWDERNVVAHVRFNERTDAQGRTVLFIEEIQSDWHQAGRKKGYRKPALTRDDFQVQEYTIDTLPPDALEFISSGDTFLKYINRHRSENNQVTGSAPAWVITGKETGEFLGTTVDREVVDKWIDERIRDSASRSGVPDAPFKTTWPLLAFKRMIRWAAENGFEVIAWTPGEIQAERYDLSRQVDKITWNSDGDVYNLSAWRGSERVPIKDFVPEAKLEDYVGKEPAKRIIETEAARRRGETTRTFIADEDLKVGGEGMVTFYDKMLPKMVGKYVKKWGAKVGVGEISTQGGLGAHDGMRLRHEVLDPNGEVYDAFETLEAAQQAASDAGPGYSVGTHNVTRQVWSVPITEKMRQAALAGQPAYSIKKLEDLPEDVQLAFRQAEAKARTRPLWVTGQKPPAGVDPAAWEQHGELAEKAMAAAAARVEKKLVKEYKLHRARWAMEAKQLVWQDEDLALVGDIVGEWGFNTEALRAEFDEEVIYQLAKRHPQLVSDEGRVIPEIKAASLGMTTGELIQRVIDSKNAAELTQEYISQKTGDWIQEQDNLELALTQEFEDLLASEVELLSKMAGRELPPEEAPAPAPVPQVSLDKILAERDQLRAAFQRADRAARAALRKGFLEGAAAERARQKEISGRLRQRRALSANRQSLDRYFKRVVRSQVYGPDQLVGIEWDYLVQIRQLLANYGRGLVPPSLVPEGAPSLREFLDTKRSSVVDVSIFGSNAPKNMLEIPGEMITIPEWIIDGPAKPMHKMTAEELDDLKNAVRQLETLGRNEKRLLASRRHELFMDAVGEVTKTVEQANRQGKVKGLRELMDLKDGVKLTDKAARLRASLLKAETIFRMLDGKDRGPLWENLFYPIYEAENREMTLGTEILTRLQEAFERIPLDQRREWHKQKTLPGVPVPLSREEMLMVALNCGNKGNRTALREGYGQFGWSEGTVQTILEELSSEELLLVQEIWDVLELLWPGLQALHFKMTGVRLPKVERQQVYTSRMTLEGGYFPLVWDPALSAAAGKIAGMKEMRDLMASRGLQRATTRAGATHERKGGKLPPLLSFRVIYQHVAEVVHDIAFRAAVRDVQKILSHPTVKAAIEDTRLGPAGYGQLMPWLAHVAQPEWGTADVREEAAGYLRRNTTSAMLGLKISVALVQQFSLFNTQEALGGTWTARGLAEFWRNPWAAVELVNGLSPAVAQRKNTWDRELRNMVRQFRPAGQTLREDLNTMLFAMIGWNDAFAVYPTFLGAYKKALHEGLSEAKAIEEADRIVRITQPAAAPKDLAAIQRGTELQKSLLMFYTFFAQVEQRARVLGYDTGEGRMSWLKRMRSWWWLYVAPAMAVHLLKERNADPKEMGKAVVSYYFARLPFVRDMVGSFLSGFDYSMSPIAGVGRTVKQLLEDANRMAQGKRVKGQKVAEHVIDLGGYLFGLPSKQAIISLRGFMDIVNGKTKGPWDAATGLLVHKNRRRRR